MHLGSLDEFFTPEWQVEGPKTDMAMGHCYLEKLGHFMPRGTQTKLGVCPGEDEGSANSTFADNGMICWKDTLLKDEMIMTNTAVQDGKGTRGEGNCYIRLKITNGDARECRHGAFGRCGAKLMDDGDLELKREGII